MGTYNNTTAQLPCPRCGSVETFEIDLYFGYTAEMVTVPIGTPYPFRAGNAPQNGGPLTHEHPRGMGYAECPHCGKDFHCAALIQDGVLISIVPAQLELPLIPDREASRKAKCPECQSSETRLQFFDGFPFAKLICDACSSITQFRHDGSQNIVGGPVTKEHPLGWNP